MTEMKYIIPFVFAASVAITFLELFCTGQVYLPTIVYLESLKGYRHTAMLYLFLYCLLFILPLLYPFFETKVPEPVAPGTPAA